MKKKLSILLFIGLILRLVLSVMGHNGDIDNYHIVWALSVIHHGLPGFYARNFNGVTANYPAIPIYLFTFLYQLYYWLDAFFWKLNIIFPLFPSYLVILWRNPTVLIPALMKLPAIFTDIAFAYLIYLFAIKLVKDKKSSCPLIAASLILFNPAFFYNSSFWGQIDIIPIFFVMWAFYVIIAAGLTAPVLIRRATSNLASLLTSVILFTLGLLTKQTVVVFIPLYLLLIWKKYGIKKLLISSVIPVIIIFLIFIPFYKSGNPLFFPYLTFYDKLTAGFGSIYLTAHAFNFWVLITGFGHIPDGPYRYVGLSAVGILSMIVLYILYKRNFKMNDIIFTGFLIPWTVFLFATRMHERHLLMTLPFLLLAGLKNRKVMTIFIFLSIFHFINLYSGWWQPHIGILITLFSPDMVIKGFIVVTIGLYTYLYYRYVA